MFGCVCGGGEGFEGVRFFGGMGGRGGLRVSLVRCGDRFGEECLAGVRARPPTWPPAGARGHGVRAESEQKKTTLSLSLFSPSLSPPRTRRVDDPVRPAHVAQPLKLGGQPGDGGQVVPLGAPVQDGLDLRREEGAEAKTGVSKAGGGARAAPSPPQAAAFASGPPLLLLAPPTNPLTFSSRTHSTPRLASRAVFRSRKTWRTYRG